MGILVKYMLLEKLKPRPRFLCRRS